MTSDGSTPQLLLLLLARCCVLLLLDPPAPALELLFTQLFKLLRWHSFRWAGVGHESTTAWGLLEMPLPPPIVVTPPSSLVAPQLLGQARTANWSAITAPCRYLPGQRLQRLKSPRQPRPIAPPPSPPRGTPATGPGSGGCRSMPERSKMGCRPAFRSELTYPPTRH